MRKNNLELLNERNGTLKNYNLWSFWDSISEENKNKILYYFENTPLMFDYKTLFSGNWQKDIYHGPISDLLTLLVNNNLQLTDLFYKKFLEYTPLNYGKNSQWGNSWNDEKEKAINGLISKTSVLSDKWKLLFLERVKLLTIEDIYWNDSHIFNLVYSKIVYKAYLNGDCSIERFINAVNYSINNIDIIKVSITKIHGWETPLSNSVIDQYLVYLEKQKEYQKCIDLIHKIKDKGWRNDFEKRLARCYVKLNK